jgi:hypothetical protein
MGLPTHSALLRGVEVVSDPFPERTRIAVHVITKKTQAFLIVDSPTIFLSAKGRGLH